MDNGSHRQTVRHLYDFIQSHLYFSRPDLQVKRERFNSTLLFTVVTPDGGSVVEFQDIPNRLRKKL